MPLHLTLADSESGRRVNIELPYQIVIDNDPSTSVNTTSTTDSIVVSEPSTGYFTSTACQSTSSEGSNTTATVLPATVRTDYDVFIDSSQDSCSTTTRSAGPTASDPCTDGLDDGINEIHLDTLLDVISIDHSYAVAPDPLHTTTIGFAVESDAVYGISADSENTWKNYILRSIFPVDTGKAYFIEPFVFNDFVLGISVETAYTSLNMMGIPYNTVTGTNFWPNTTSTYVGRSVARMLERCDQMAETFIGKVFYKGDRADNAVYMSAVHPRRLLEFILRSCTDIPVIFTSNPGQLYANGKFLSEITDNTLDRDRKAACHFIECQSSVVSTYVGPPGCSESEMEYPVSAKFCSYHCKKVNPQHQVLYFPIITSLDIDSSHISVYAYRYRESFLVRTKGVERTDIHPTTTLICRMPHYMPGITPGTSRVMRIFRLNSLDGHPSSSDRNGVHFSMNHDIRAILRRMYNLQGEAIFNQSN